MAMKKFVPVIASFEEDGKLTPLKVTWEDGRVFEIDQVLDMRPGVSLKADDQGMRYLCRIMKKDVCMYYAEPIGAD